MRNMFDFVIGLGPWENNGESAPTLANDRYGKMEGRKARVHVDGVTNRADVCVRLECFVG